MRRLILASLMALAACTNANDLDEPTADLGNFLLGHNVVIASKAQKGPLSRDASAEEMSTAIKAAIDDRFLRYDGDHYYHLGVSVEGYNIALPGVPLVAAPKSVLILNLTVWDDAQQVKLTPEPVKLTVFESFSGDTIIGSGLTKSKEEQLANLAANTAKQIEQFLEQNREWFGPLPAPTSAKGRAMGIVAKPGLRDATAPAAPAAAAPVTAPSSVHAPVAAPAPPSTTEVTPPPAATGGGLVPITSGL
ncbi:hypothetical protein [Pseudooceanicola sp. LIPI14-2-Ac024]|uniref:hypothetical protein n=1 Tax=Pseudooceanicola sp. LIPI14-2-Ac024 TaxID=3344875 RepID=UPI0035CEB7AA